MCPRELECVHAVVACSVPQSDPSNKYTCGPLLCFIAVLFITRWRNQCLNTKREIESRAWIKWTEHNHIVDIGEIIFGKQNSRLKGQRPSPPTMHPLPPARLPLATCHLPLYPKFTPTSARHKAWVETTAIEADLILQRRAVTNRRTHKRRGSIVDIRTNEQVETVTHWLRNFHSDLLESLNDDEMRDMATHAIVRHYNPNDMLFLQGWEVG